MANKVTKEFIKNEITQRLDARLGSGADAATNEQYYRAAAELVVHIITQKRADFNARCLEAKTNAKSVNYLCMEFLMGRSLKNSLFSLGIEGEFAAALSDMGVTADEVFDCEPDAGLGNGGLGRLAACYLDSLAALGYNATGYSILYEYGIFRQKLVEGWQTELPDNWLPGGEVWLQARPDEAVEVRFDGQVNDYWDENGFHVINHVGYTAVSALPYDMMVAGDGGVATLRLWSARQKQFDMDSFNSGDFLSALQQNSMAEVISKVLYPADNHLEGKSLRLRQQYFLVAASVQDIVRKHVTAKHPIASLPDRAAIHINDTHPALAIPELMRILMDECGYGWEVAASITGRTVAYTNHTVMSEALETWPVELFKQRLPRIYQIVREIATRQENALRAEGVPATRIARMAVIHQGQIRMANLCCAVCHSVNGVSRLHTDILRRDVFSDFYSYSPEKFRSVTNGITFRRWLCQSNPRLSSLCDELIGDGYKKDAAQLAALSAFSRDTSVLERILAVKHQNKTDFSNVLARQGIRPPDPSSVFDVQVKRLHEYKRQLLNALHILSRYMDIKDGSAPSGRPQTFIFGAKAAPGYYMAKEIIRLISHISSLIEADPAVKDLIRVVFLEDYRVTVAEKLMPAADISEQISLAGTEASGTGNMKLMLNGAVTLGTMDGATVEIYDAVGADNIFIFGMDAQTAAARRPEYRPAALYESNAEIKRLIDTLKRGICGRSFTEIADNLCNTDQYMVLAELAAYKEAQARMRTVYDDRMRFGAMSLENTAKAGIFSSDRAIAQYAAEIWGAAPVFRDGGQK